MTRFAIGAIGLGVCLFVLRLGTLLGEPEPFSVGVQDDSSAQAPDTVDLVFEREVFSYPTFERRNPFRPLTGAESGPRFEELVLLGIISSANSAGSVALLGTRAGGSGGASTYRVREGENLGNVRVLEIRPQQLLVAVSEFGVTENRTMELRRAEPGEPSPLPGDASGGAEPPGLQEAPDAPDPEGDPGAADEPQDFQDPGDQGGPSGEGTGGTTEVEGARGELPSYHLARGYGGSA